MSRSLLVVLAVASTGLLLGACASTGGSGGSSTRPAVPMVEVTARSLNVRQEPSTSGAVVGSLAHGEQVQAPQAEADGWLYVESASGTTGYVSANYVRPVAAAGGSSQQAAAEPAPREASAEKEAAAPSKEAQGRPAPAGSKLARVELGMSEAKVVSILGEPTSQENYMTGKQWIPYYYGSDTSRLDYKYKGVGMVVFGRNRYSGKTRVIRVDYDPGEDGL